MMAYSCILFFITALMIIRTYAESTTTDSSSTPLLITEKTEDRPTKVILFLASIEDIRPEVFSDFDVKSEVQLTEPGRSCFSALDCRVSTMLDWSRTQNSTATGVVTWALSSVSTVISNPSIQSSPEEMSRESPVLIRRKREEHVNKELEPNLAWDMRHFADMIRRLFSRHFAFPENGDQPLAEGSNLRSEFGYTLRELQNIATKFFLVVNVQNASEGQLESTIAAALNKSAVDDKTLLIITGRCPDEKLHMHKGNALLRLIREAAITEPPKKSVPLYAKGLRSNELIKPKYIWEVPDAIMAAIGGPSLPEHPGTHKVMDGISHKVFEKHFYGSMVEEPLEIDERDQVTSDIFSQLFGEELASKLETARKRHLAARKNRRPISRKSTRKPKPETTSAATSTKSAEQKGKYESVALSNTADRAVVTNAAPNPVISSASTFSSGSVPVAAAAPGSASGPLSASASVTKAVQETPLLNVTRSKRAAPPHSNTIRRPLEARFGETAAAENESRESAVPPLALVVGAVGSMLSIVGIVAALTTGKLRRFHDIHSSPSV